MDADITSQAVGLASNTDFSILSLFLRADFIVKSVIIILIASSVYSWAIIFDKIFMFRRINKDSEDFEERFWKSKSAETFYNSLPTSLDNPMAQLFKDSMQAVLKSRSKTNISQRLEKILEVNIEKQMNVVNNKFTFLATVGSTAPFIRLFGTVWGIMHSFRGLATSSQATLAAVAPGISEALIATAMGLFAAIPAVLAYNRFAAKADALLNRYESFVDEFSGLLQRQSYAQKRGGS